MEGCSQTIKSDGVLLLTVFIVIMEEWYYQIYLKLAFLLHSNPSVSEFVLKMWIFNP